MRPLVVFKILFCPVHPKVFFKLFPYAFMKTVTDLSECIKSGLYSQSQILLAEKKLKATTAVMKDFLKADTVIDSKKKLQQY